MSDSFVDLEITVRRVVGVEVFRILHRLETRGLVSDVEAGANCSRLPAGEREALRRLKRFFTAGGKSSKLDPTGSVYDDEQEDDYVN